MTIVFLIWQGSLGWDIRDPDVGISQTKTLCKWPFSVVFDREWPECPGIWVGTSRIWKNFMQENFGLIFCTLQTVRETSRDESQSLPLPVLLRGQKMPACYRGVPGLRPKIRKKKCSRYSFWPRQENRILKNFKKGIIAAKPHFGAILPILKAQCVR